jgi:hypothetical protein
MNLRSLTLAALVLGACKMESRAPERVSSYDTSIAKLAPLFPVESGLSYLVLDGKRVHAMIPGEGPVNCVLLEVLSSDSAGSRYVFGDTTSLCGKTQTVLPLTAELQKSARSLRQLAVEHDSLLRAGASTHQIRSVYNGQHMVLAMRAYDLAKVLTPQ